MGPPKKRDVEAGGLRAVPMALESPEQHWFFIRKVYSIIAMQLLVTVAVAATVNLVAPLTHFLVHTKAGLALYIVVIFIPFIGSTILG